MRPSSCLREAYLPHIRILYFFGKNDWICSDMDLCRLHDAWMRSSAAIFSPKDTF
jgi:hypothetical protein